MLPLYKPSLPFFHPRTVLPAVMAVHMVLYACPNAWLPMGVVISCGTACGGDILVIGVLV
jgi:hypothetical protein